MLSVELQTQYLLRSCVCRCVWLVHVCVCSLIWQKPKLGGAFPWKTNKSSRLEAEKGKNAMSIILVKCVITGYKDACGTAPAGKPVSRNWNACWGMVQRLLSGAAQWKSNRITLGKDWLRKYSLEQKIWLGEEKKKEFSPKRRTDSKNANLFKPSRARRTLSTSCLNIQMWCWKEVCKAVKSKKK